MEISMKIHGNFLYFFTHIKLSSSTTNRELRSSNHLNPRQVVNCDSNSRLVVDDDDNVKSGLKGLESGNIFI